MRNKIAALQSHIRNKRKGGADEFFSFSSHGEVGCIDSFFENMMKDLDHKGGRKGSKGSSTGDSNSMPEKKPFTEAMWFKIVIYSAIIFNAVMMGVEVDYPAKKYPEKAIVYAIFENFFTALFFVEMLCKFYTERRGYFKSGWNCLDFFLVNMAVVDVWLMKALGGGGALKKFSVLRILRIMRIARMVRLMKTFQSLWLIIKGMIDSTRMIGWVALLLLMSLYVCAIFCTRRIGHEVEKYPGYSLDADDFDEVVAFNNYQYFGSIGRAMFTLFNIAILVGDYDMVGRATIEKQPWFIVFLLFFILFTAFGVMNVVIGVIVDNTTQAAQGIRSDEAAQEAKTKLLALGELYKVIRSLDKDNDGTISLDEVELFLATPDATRGLALLASDLPHFWTGSDLFNLLDSMGKGKITTDEFLRNAFRLVGVKDDKAKTNEILIGLHEAFRMGRVMDKGLFDLSETLINVAKHRGISHVPSTEMLQPPVQVKSPVVPSPIVPSINPVLESNPSSIDEDDDRQGSPTQMVTEQDRKLEEHLIRLEEELERTCKAQEDSWRDVSMFLSNLSLELAKQNSGSPEKRSPSRQSGSEKGSENFFSTSEKQHEGSSPPVVPRLNLFSGLKLF